MRFSFGECEFDLGRRELRRAGKPVSIEPQVFDVLAHLIDNRDRVVSKDDLISAVWGGRAISDSALTTRINQARSAIGDSGEQQRLIKTLPRKGFRFIGDVYAQDAATTAPAPPSMARPKQDVTFCNTPDGVRIA